jgi:hypothetical protein
MNTSAYKVHVKLGAAEFEAEGPEETVKEQLAHFYIAATQPVVSQPVQTNGNGNGKNGGSTIHVNGNGNGNGIGAETAVNPVNPYASPDLELRTRVDPKLIARLFKEKNGVMTLSVLPKSDNRNQETLLLILWGYYVLKNQLEVSSMELLTAMRGSGVTNLNRIDETAEKKDYRKCFTCGGSRKGKRFGLSNCGLEIAEEMAENIFR